MPQRPYKVRQKISQTMKGTSNFAGQTHSIGSKAKISDRRGHYDPISDKKWFVHHDSGKTIRRTQHPGGLYKRGRTEERIHMKGFIDYVLQEAMSKQDMVKKMSDEHPEARFRTNPLKPVMSKSDREAQKKNLGKLLDKKMNEGKLKDMVTGHMTTGKGMSYDKAVKKAQKDLDKMKPKQPSQQMKSEEKMTPGQAAMKKLDSRPSNIALRNAIANVNCKAQDKINQRTKKAKADSKPKNYVNEIAPMRGPQRGSQPQKQTAAQKRKEQEFNKRAGIIEPEEAPSAFQGSTKPRSYYR